MDTVPPGKPADCDFDWGHSVELTPGRPGALACTSDSVMGQQGETDGSRTLPYGDSVTYHGILCTSTRQGLRCHASGHGFLISRATIRGQLSGSPRNDSQLAPATRWPAPARPSAARSGGAISGTSSSTDSEAIGSTFST